MVVRASRDLATPSSDSSSLDATLDLLHRLLGPYLGAATTGS